MGLFKRRKKDQFAQTDDFWQLVDEVDEIREILDRRLSAPRVPPPRIVDADEVETAITDLRWHLGRIENQLGQIDQRMTSISIELANQINELATELERMAPGSELADDSPSDEAHVNGTAPGTPPESVLSRTIEELREAQIQLANEQIRYQIALRDDLAQLAERLRN